MTGHHLPDALLLVSISVSLASVFHQTLHDLLEVLSVSLDNLQLLLRVGMSLVEVVEVFRFSGVFYLMWQNGRAVALAAVFLVVLAVKAFLLDVLDGHEDLSKLRHVVKLVRIHSLRLGSHLNLLDLDLFEDLLVLRDFVCQLHNSFPLFFLILVDLDLLSLSIILQLLVLLLKRVIRVNQGVVPRQNSSNILKLVGVGSLNHL